MPTAKKLPFAILPKANKTIDSYINLEIYEQIESSEWDSIAVYQEKPDNTVRICGNYRETLIKRIKQVRYKVTATEETFNKIEKAKWYYKIDLKDAYLRIPVNRTTSEMQALTTYLSTFIVHRLYQGMKAAPVLFHQYMDQLINNLEGVIF